MAASNQVEVEVEAELGKSCCLGNFPYLPVLHSTLVRIKIIIIVVVGTPEPVQGEDGEGGGDEGEGAPLHKSVICDLCECLIVRSTCTIGRRHPIVVCRNVTIPDTKKMVDIM